MPRATFAFGYIRNARRVEWWNVYTDSGMRFVRLDLDPEWVRREASINDLKRLAIAQGV